MADRTSGTTRRRPVKDGGPAKRGSVIATPEEVERANAKAIDADQARARAALEVTAARERREVALTAAALVYRGRRRRSSVARVLEAAAEFERFLTAG
jgi:hypothetical protein